MEEQTKFSTRIICLYNEQEILLPESFRIIPYWYQSTSYIPPYMVEGEMYGGCNDFDEGMMYEEEDDKIVEYLTKNYNFNNDEDYFELHYSIENELSNIGIAIDKFDGLDNFRQIVSLLIDEYNLNDEQIYFLLKNEDVIEILCKKDYLLFKGSSLEDLTNQINSDCDIDILKIEGYTFITKTIEINDNDYLAIVYY